MRLSMEKDNGRDEILIKIYAEPIKILSVEGNIVWCEWEGSRWKMYLPTLLLQGILSPDTSEEIRNRFIARLNALLKSIGDNKEPE